MCSCLAVFRKDTDRTAKNKRMWVRGLAGRPHACWISLCLESSVNLPVHTHNHTAHTIYSPFIILTLLQSLKQLEWILALVDGLWIKAQTPYISNIYSACHTTYIIYTHSLLDLICVHWKNEVFLELQNKGQQFAFFFFKLNSLM